MDDLPEQVVGMMGELVWLRLHDDLGWGDGDTGDLADSSEKVAGQRRNGALVDTDDAG